MAIINPLGDKYSFTIANAHSGAYVVALLPGPFNTLKVTTTLTTATAAAFVGVNTYTDYTEIAYAFSNVTAIADDGTIGTSTTLTAGNANFKYRSFRNYVRQNVLFAKELQITVDNVAGLSESIEICEWTPLTQAPKTYLALTDYYDPYQTATTKVVIPLNLKITPNTVIIQNVPAGRTYTYTWKF